MRVYLAAPFFTPPQLQRVERLEGLVRSSGAELFSPRSEGTLVKMSREERAASSRKIFESNCREIRASDVVLAVIDDRDLGVVWEMGFACCDGVPIATYTDHDYGLNVMIRESVAAHLRGELEAKEFFAHAARLGLLTTVRLGRWRYVPETVT